MNSRNRGTASDCVEAYAALAAGAIRYSWCSDYLAVPQVRRILRD